MYWWNEEPNFGDAMNALLIPRLFGREVAWAPLEEADLVGTGSVLQWITPVVAAREAPIDVWGSGFIFAKEPAPPLPSVRIHALRGHASASMFGPQCRPAYGDPGLLTARAVNAPPTRFRVGVVPHLWHRDLPVVRQAVDRLSARLIDVTSDPEMVIEQIASCDVVFSSSLHGLVVADSFGIPNWWTSAAPEPFGGEFKFLDYYSVFGLQPRPLRFDDDLERVVRDRAANYQRTGLEQLCERLVAVFPG